MSQHPGKRNAYAANNAAERARKEAENALKQTDKQRITAARALLKTNT